MAGFDTATRWTWLAPPGCSPAEFSATRAEIERVLRGPLAQVYQVGHRRVYAAESPLLGPLAVKEAWQGRAWQRFGSRWFRQAKPVREFFTAAEFLARGGNTHRVFACGLDQGWLAQRRVVLVYQWLAGTMTLAEYVRRRQGWLSPASWRTLAQQLVDDARRGLVHGGHSPENILVRPGNPPRFFTIDFAESRVGSGFEPGAFAADLARIAVKFELYQLGGTELVEAFLAAACEAAWPKRSARESGAALVWETYRAARAARGQGLNQPPAERAHAA